MSHRVRSILPRTALLLAVALSCGAAGPAGAAGDNYAGARAGLHSAVDDYGRTVVEGGVLGAFAGAATGAMAGLLSGDNRNIGRGALFGAAIGGLGGLIDGTAVAESKKQYARAEDGLDEAVRKARLRNAKLTKVVASADKLVALRRAELSRLKSEGSAERRADLQRAVDDDIREIDSALSKARTARDEARSLLDRYRNTGNSGGLKQEVSANDDAVRRLASGRAELETMRNGL